MLKIVMTAYSFYPRIGGVSTVVGTMAECFVNEGHEVTVITLTPGPSTDFPYRVVRNPGPAAHWRLFRRADVVILSNLSVRLIYPLLVMGARIALQHHSESAFHVPGSSSIADTIRARVMARSTHFVCSAYIGRRSGLRNFEVVHPAIKPEYANRERRRPPEKRRGLLYVGRMEPEKGVQWLLDRWPRIQSELGVEELRFAGEGSLDHRVREYGEHQGVFHLGVLDALQTAEEMGRTRYLIVPSLWAEPFGAVALEGVATGAITIVADRGGLREAAGDLGFYFDPDRDETFIRALRAARTTCESQLADRGNFMAWGERIAGHLEHFEPGRLARKYLDLLVPDHGR